MRVLFKNGTVVSGKGTRRADVLVDGEKIRRVAREIHVDDAQIVDAAGMLLMPGFIDAHTHFDLDVCNTTTADDFASGSRAALRGGTTTIVDFACPNKGETLHDGLRLWHEKADGKCACDYGFHMTIDEMLVYIPQLTQRKNKLAEMKARLPKERVEEQYGRQSNIIDYTYANYDLAAVEADYEETADALSRAQLALDAVNQRDTFELEE